MINRLRSGFPSIYDRISHEKFAMLGEKEKESSTQRIGNFSFSSSIPKDDKIEKGENVSIFSARESCPRRYSRRVIYSHDTKRGRKRWRDGHVNGRYLFTPLGHQYKW